MNRSRAIKGIVISLSIAALVLFLGSSESVTVGGVPLFLLCGAVIFAIHWVVFVPSFIFRTEHYFDVTGSICYVSTVIFAWNMNPERGERSLLLGALVILWAVRLGSFLFWRVKKRGMDDRFERLKNDFLSFLMVWTLSGLWVMLTAATVFAALTTGTNQGLDGFAYAGLLVWGIGMLIEIVADSQKTRFRSNPLNRNKFITEGLWSLSRHPNYFGEIVLWFGMALIAFPTLQGLQMAVLVSPFFVWFLLTKVSGVPFLERKAQEKWGDDEDYVAYEKRTHALIPWPKKST